MNKEEFAAIFENLALAFGGEKDKRRIELYYKQLGHYPAATFAAAVDRAINECEFFPTIAALHSRMKQILELSGVLLSSEQAWDRTVRMLQARFPGELAELEYKDGESVDRSIWPNEACRLAVKAMGGIGVITEITKYNREARRREFIGHYEALTATAEVVGAVINGNERRRYIQFPRSVARIGDETREGHMITWDTVERRVCSDELYRLQESIMGDRDEIASGRNSQILGSGDGAGGERSGDTGYMLESGTSVVATRRRRDQRGDF